MTNATDWEQLAAKALMGEREGCPSGSLHSWFVEEIKTLLEAVTVALVPHPMDAEAARFEGYASGGQAEVDRLEHLLVSPAGPKAERLSGQLWDAQDPAVPKILQEYLAERGASALWALTPASGLEPRLFLWACFEERPDLSEACQAAIADALNLIGQRARLELLEKRALVQGVKLREALARAEEASAAKSRFLANVSHEIRTPLTAIVGFSHLLVSRSGAEEQRKAWAEHVNLNADFLLGLINDTLDLSKAEAGAFELNLGDHSPLESLAHVESLMGPVASENGLSLVFDETGPVPDCIRTDPIRLRQIVLNLVSNSIKYTDQGEVRVSIGLEPEIEGTPRVFSILVKDTGIGIPRKDIPMLFRMFRQVHGDENRFKGTGLGLALVKHFCEMLDGEVSVDSEEGVGTSILVRFRLPWDYDLKFDNAAGSSPKGERSSSQETVLANRRILVVDDNSTNRELFGVLLREWGAIVEEAVNGREGVDQALEQDAAGTGYDIILMDSRMPVLTGERAIDELWQAGYERPIAMLTANASQVEIDEHARGRLAGILAKPIQPAWFPRQVAELMGITSESDADAEVDELTAAQDRVMKRMAAKLIGSFPDLVKESQGFVGERDGDSLQSLLHRLKGTAGSFGLEDISRMAGACERQLKEGRSIDDLADEMTELHEFLTSVHSNAA